MNSNQCCLYFCFSTLYLHFLKNVCYSVLLVMYFFLMYLCHPIMVIEEEPMSFQHFLIFMALEYFFDLYSGHHYFFWRSPLGCMMIISWICLAF